VLPVQVPVGEAQRHNCHQREHREGAGDRAPEVLRSAVHHEVQAPHQRAQLAMVLIPKVS